MDQFDEERWLYAAPCADDLPPVGPDRGWTTRAGAAGSMAVPQLSAGAQPALLAPAPAAGGGLPPAGGAAHAPAPTSPQEWGGLDLYAIRDRSERLGRRMQALGDRVRLSDFEVIKKFGEGANAQAYLAQCKAGAQLGAHVDALVVLKVLLHYKQPGGAALGATTSGMDREFMAGVEKETRGPGFPEYRFNVVSRHAL